MRIFMRTMIYVLSVVFMTGCMSYQQMSLDTKNVSACSSACFELQKKCSAVCHNNAEHCETMAKQSTKNFFCRYKQEQYIKGNFVARELNSYRDPLQCRKITCDCWADYRVCKAACTNTIHKRLQAPQVY